MAKVIVVTNFSEASRNALDYTCRFLNNPSTSVLLLNIYFFPGSFTGDPIAIAGMNETITNDSARLDEELEWVNENHPQINITAEMSTGVFLEELRERAAAAETALIVMGTEGKYSDLLSWDANIIDAFVDMTTPVLIVPAKVRFRPMQKIAFALNYYRPNLRVPIEMIRKIVNFTKANLFVINVVSPTEVITEEGMAQKKIMKESIADLDPEYYEPAFDNVITAIDKFIAAEGIDLMIVIPSRHGIWYNIFQKSHTRGIVYLNNVPILSLHREGGFLE
jgi:hypothetical protein